MDEAVEEDDEELERLSEIGDGSIVALSSISAQRVTEVVFSYVVTALAGPGFYGLLSVLTRLEGRVFGRLTEVIRLGLNRTLPRLDHRGQNVIVTAVIPIVLLTWVVSAVPLLLFPDYVIELTILSAEHETAVQLFGLSLVPIFLMSVANSVFKSYKQIRLANVVETISKPLAVLVGATVGLVLFSEELLAVWGVISVCLTAVSVFAVVLILREAGYRPTYDPSFGRDILDFLLFMRDTAAGTVLGAIQYAGPFVLMAVLLSPVSAGLFSLAYIFGGIIRWPLASVNQIFPPIMTELYADGETDSLNRLYQITSLLILFVSVLPFLVMLVYHAEIVGVFSEAYVSDSVVLPVIAFGQLVAGTIGSIGLLLFMTDNQRELMWLQVPLVLVVVPVAVWLTLRYGVSGLAVGTAIILAANNVSELLLIRYLEGLNPFTVRHAKMGTLAAGVAVPMYALSAVLAPAQSVLVFGAGLVSYVYVGFVYVLSRRDRYVLRAVWNTILGRGTAP